MGSRSLAIVCTLVSMWTKLVVALTLLSKVTPAKPVCDPREPCKIGLVGLEFCTCPNGGRCPNAIENMLTYQNVNYYFCQPQTFHQCSNGEVAWVRRSLRQSVFCICPEPLRLSSEIWDIKTDTTKYTCTQPRQCLADEMCMVRNRVFLGARTVSLLQTLCECPTSQQCLETGVTVKENVVELERDVYKCAMPPTEPLDDDSFYSPDEKR